MIDADYGPFLFDLFVRNVGCGGEFPLDGPCALPGASTPVALVPGGIAGLALAALGLAGSASRRRRTGALAAALLVAGAVSARATTRVVEFEGVVATLTADRGLFGAPGTVKIGDPFSGHLSYEVGPGNPDQIPSDPEMGLYTLTDFVVDQAVLPWTSLVGAAVLHELGLPTIPPDPPDPGRDSFRVLVQSDPYPSVSLTLEGPFGSAFVDDSLPPSLDLADFPDAAFVRGLVAFGLYPNPNIEDVGTLTALHLVPEPGSLLLGATAIATLALRRRA